MLNILSFHLMPWPYLPEDYAGPAWVALPNAMFDRKAGSILIQQYLDQLVACEAFGFDGVAVNEHHQTGWGLMGSPNVAAAMIIARTERLKVLVMGPALPLYGSPTRIAEEVALLDLVSNGRVIFGPVIGGPPEYLVAGIDPGEARGRYREALALIIRAWTEDGPFEHLGEYYSLQHVNPWLRPVQSPHPAIWIPGAGSPETIDFAVEHGYTYSALPFFPKVFTDKSFAMYRSKWIGRGHEADASRLSLLLPIYVAETDEQARQEFEPHFWYWAKRLTRGQHVAAPGYASEQTVLRMMAAAGGFAWDADDWQDVEREGFAIVGSPETVRRKLIERIEEVGAGNLMGMFQIGSMGHDLVMSSLQLFSSEVMPHLRAHFAEGPVWPESRAAIAERIPVHEQI